jgi:8-amino-7-oxononanoate synthase
LFQARAVTGPVAGRITVDGRPYINFFGSGYLALSDLPEIRGAVLRALEAGAPFSQQVPAALDAVDPYLEAVERTAAATLAADATVYLPSGYMIGMVLFAAVDEDLDHVLIDEGAHFSLKDAAKLSGLPLFTFAHCDAQSLADELQRSSRARRRPLVVTDGVFASSGRVPPLADYAELIAPYDGRLLVDESHAFGVVGSNGRGAAEYCGVERVAMIGATLGKAFCAQGAVVACSPSIAALVRQQPPIRGACAGSPLSAAAATAAMQYSFRHPEIRENLRATADYLRMRLRVLGLEVIDTPAPIVSFKSGNRADMLSLQQRAWQRGICIYHSTYIGAGDEGMIRCAVFRDHSRADIDALVAAIQ